MQKEIFKDIPGYEGIYQASNLGRIKSLRRIGVRNNRILNHSICNNVNYLRVKLSRNKIYKVYFVHQLIAMAFLNHKPNGHKLVVDHIDNNSFNNNLNNLQIVTTRKNLSKDKIGYSSEYTGVSLDKKSGKWKASMFVNNKQKTIGRFKT